MSLSFCFLIFVGLSQISPGEENTNKSDSTVPAKGVDYVVSALTNKIFEEHKRRLFRIIFSRVRAGNIKAKKFRHRRKRSIGSVKVQGLMKPRY